MAHSMNEIAQLLKKTTFRSRFIGGVDENDVWEKIAHLQKEYEALMLAQQEQCRGALREQQIRMQGMEQRLHEATQQLNALQSNQYYETVWDTPANWPEQWTEQARHSYHYPAGTSTRADRTTAQAYGGDNTTTQTHRYAVAGSEDVQAAEPAQYRTVVDLQSKQGGRGGSTYGARPVETASPGMMPAAPLLRGRRNG